MYPDAHSLAPDLRAATAGSSVGLETYLREHVQISRLACSPGCGRLRSGSRSAARAIASASIGSDLPRVLPARRSGTVSFGGTRTTSSPRARSCRSSQRVSWRQSSTAHNRAKHGWQPVPRWAVLPMCAPSGDRRFVRITVTSITEDGHEDRRRDEGAPRPALGQQQRDRRRGQRFLDAPTECVRLAAALRQAAAPPNAAPHASTPRTRASAGRLDGAGG
jgi:hypothetical protein